MQITREMKDDWCLWQDVATDQMVEARLQLHHAAQLVAAMGKYLLPERPDDSHTSLHWSSEFQALAGESVSEDGKLYGAIRPRDLTLLLIDETADTTQEFPLDKQPLQDGLSWLKETLSEKEIDTSTLSLKMHYDIPEHAVADGAAFNSKHPEAFVEFARFYGNFNLLLQQLSNETPEASAVICWPHHFDIATLITLEANDNPEKKKTVGVGLSPGDGSYELPYVYVSPWPGPDIKDADLPSLSSGGRWHTEGWFGAVLTSDQLVRGPEADPQIQQIIDYISSAVSEAKNLLS